LRWSPAEFWAASLTEFIAALDFWCEVNGVKESGDAPSRARVEELKAKYG
jgi:hypothetical protein